ncbi:MAG: TonB-dependent receptor plug domain-containing protein [Sulfuricaulis sp.]|nr:TonB-dependent receptor plug domain-containing protein [Sulfuricaulis sp.]
MKQFLYWLHLFVFSTCMICGSSLAAEYPSELDYLQEFPVVLSASRLSQPITETPNAMTVIDRDMIVASGARNIADLFKLVPSMYVGYANGHTPIVSYRGVTDGYARRMQVLVDGRSIYLPIFGQVDWAELPIDIADIELIEVIRGPSAASHGSNSVQGVISIFTRRAADARKAEVSLRMGDADTSDVSARFGGNGESWDYRVTLASRGDTGFVPNFQYVGKIPLNDSSRTQLINTRINYRPTGSDSLDIQLGYSDSTRMLGDKSPSAFDEIVRNQKIYADYEQLTWLRTLDMNNDLQLSYYHMGRNTRDERYSLPVIAWGGGSFLIAENAIVHRHDLEMQHTLRTSPDNRVVWGMGARQDSAEAPNLLRYAPSWREYRLFAHDEWRITPVSLVNIGAMAEKNALGQTRVSPRISYNHHLTPRNTLRASVSVAYRNPEMMEELGDQSVSLNPPRKWQNISTTGGLSPEKTISREIGYLGQLDDAGSTFDVRAFHDQISNIIWVDYNLDPAVFNYFNPFKTVMPVNFKSDFNAYYSGLEATLKYNLGARSKLTVNYSHQIAGATPSRVSDFYYPAYGPFNALLNTYINTELQKKVNQFAQTVPLHSGSLLFSHDFSGGTQLGVGFYQIGPVKSLDAGTLQPLTRYLDLRLAQRFGSKRSKVGSGEIALVVQNALSDNYFDYSTDTRNRRRAYLTATLEL